MTQTADTFPMRLSGWALILAPERFVENPGHEPRTKIIEIVASAGCDCQIRFTQTVARRAHP